jgi:hypothetical protein
MLQKHDEMRLWFTGAGFFEQTANHNFLLTTRPQNATGKFISL